MRRTYLSKRDSFNKYGVHVLDQRQSAFEAFYIDNIKQAKREQSCLTSTNRAQNSIAKKTKTRRRKYVKRIVTDVDQHLNESVAKSTYLTPDKSIHVKRNDLFDQLLNSTPTIKAFNASVEKDPFDELCLVKEDHPHQRSLCLTKKYKRSNNKYSNNDSEDSDKENKTKPDTTDLNQFPLVIDTGTKNHNIHDLTNNNLSNLSILSNLKSSSICKAKRLQYVNLKKHRLTDNLQTPKKGGSPTTSTPFVKKNYRKSIYNLSPISLDDNEKTLRDQNGTKSSTINLENVVNTCHSNIENIEKELHFETIHGRSFQNVITNNQNIVDKKSSANDSIKKIDSKSSSPFETVHNPPYIQNSMQDNIVETQNSSCNNSKSFIEFIDKSYNGNMQEDLKSANVVLQTSIETSILEKTDFKPFLGFANLTANNEQDVKMEPQYSFCDNSKSIIEFIDKSHGNMDADMKSTSGVLQESVKTSLAGRTDFEPLFRFAHISETQDALESGLKDCMNKFEIATENVDSKDNKISCTESLYDTCHSLDSTSSSCDQSPVLNKELNVCSQRLNDSSFLRYQKMPSHFSLCSENSSPDTDSDLDKNGFDNNGSEMYEESFDSNTLPNLFSEDREHSRNSSRLSNSNLILLKNVTQEDVFVKCYETSLNDNQKELSESLNTTPVNVSLSDQDDSQRENETIEYVTSSDEVDSESENEINKNGAFVSFVTTRKRNDVINDSIIMVFDSPGCTSTRFSECDNTVVNIETYKPNYNTKAIKTNSEDFGENNATFVQYQHCEAVNERSSPSVQIPMNSETLEHNEPVANKPHIVLEPGKKWERSLSIYKRLTLLNGPSDLSILDDTTIKTKGRKYRESIIHTMEKQEFHKDFHRGESFNARPSSTFFKLSRPTMKVVKEERDSNFSKRSTLTFGESTGFLSEDCDDTLNELSNLSIADADNKRALEKVEDTTVRLPSALDYVLRRCNQTEPILFNECYPDTVLKNCRKIGEGVYGEVYLWRPADGRGLRVLKVVPVGGDVRVNGEQQKDFADIIAEIVIAMELSALRAPIALIDQHFDEGKDLDTLDLHTIQNATDAFNEVLAVRCVYGQYASRLLDLWELYDETKGSENDSPSILPSDQHYIVLELANAGQDLEGYVFNNAEQAYYLFVQIAFALAVAEEAYQFEHRDLHWGNVLIASTDQKYCTFVLRGRGRRVALCGARATIIDYSLSRVSLPVVTPAAERVTLYNDLAADESLFSAVGDYQFDVYRHMKHKLGNDWKNFEPYTNILWLHYTVDKMITAVHYKRTNTKIHKNYITKLKGIKNRILDYGSAVQFVLTDNEFSMLTN